MGLPSRSVIREEAFEDELRVLIGDAKAADEFARAAEWVLANDPFLGTLTDAGPPAVWALPMPPVDERTLWLLYSFDEAAVIFLGLRLL